MDARLPGHRQRHRRAHLRLALRGGRQRPARHQGPPAGELEPVRPGRHRVGLEPGRHLRGAHRRHARRRRRPLPSRRRRARRARGPGARPRADRARRRASTAARTARAAAYDLGREGGHSQRRILHALDATGHEIMRALSEAVRATPQHPHPREPPRGRPARSTATSDARRPAGAPTCSIARPAQVAPHARARDGARDRRRRQGLPLHDEPRRRDRRRHRDGVSRRRAGREHGVHPVPPDLPLPPAGEVVPDHRGAARRGRRAAPSRRRALHGALRPARRARAARHRRARDRQRDEGARLRVACTSTSPIATRDFVRERFPTIYERCLRFGIDITKEPIPVVPAAHYCCGGVVTDLDGRTAICRASTPAARSPAPGCTARTGWRRTRCSRRWSSAIAPRAHARAACARDRAAAARASAAGTPARATDSDEAVVVTQNWDEIRRFMWNYVGIVRSDRRLDARAPAHRAAPGGDPRSTTGTCCSPATWSSCATSRRSPS